MEMEAWIWKINLSKILDCCVLWMWRFTMRWWIGWLRGKLLARDVCWILSILLFFSLVFDVLLALRVIQTHYCGNCNLSLLFCSSVLVEGEIILPLPFISSKFQLHCLFLSKQGKRIILNIANCSIDNHGVLNKLKRNFVFVVFNEVYCIFFIVMSYLFGTSQVHRLYHFGFVSCFHSVQHC